MPEPKHAVEKPRICDVQGCSSEAERSVPGKKLESAGFEIKSDPSKNAHLCHIHYKELKKKTKKDRTYDRLGW